MNAGRCQAEDDIARGHAAAVDHRVALHRAHGEPGKIVVARRVHARHLGRLAAHQRAAGLAAAFGNARDDGAAGIHVQLAGGEIIEEQQRLGALDDQIVDAHGDQIDADRVVLAGGDGDFQLGADPVGGGDQDGIAETRGLQIEQRAEAAEAGRGAAARRAGGQRLDRLNQSRSRIDIDAGIAIAAGVYGVLRGDGL